MVGELRAHHGRLGLLAVQHIGVRELREALLRTPPIQAIKESTCLLGARDASIELDQILARCISQRRLGSTRDVEHLVESPELVTSIERSPGELVCAHASPDGSPVAIVATTSERVNVIRGPGSGVRHYSYTCA